MRQQTPKRRRLSKEIRYAELLEAAGKVFREKGYHEASTLEIAERANVVEGTLFRYFPTKRELLNRVVESAYERTIADYDVQLQGISGTWNRLRFLIWRHLRTIRDDPQLSRLLIYEVRTQPDYRKSQIFELNRAYTRRTVGIIQDAISSGEFKTDVPVSIIRDMIYGSIDHYTWSYVRGERKFDPCLAADHITNLIYRGLSSQLNVNSDASLAGIEGRLERIEKLVARPRRASSKSAK
jgi:AcrR family transcriptional regulator